MAILRKQLKDDFSFLLSFFGKVKKFKNVNIKLTDFEMLTKKMDLKRQRLGNLMIDLIQSQREYTGVRGSSSKDILSRLKELEVV